MNMNKFVVVQTSCGRLRGKIIHSFEGYDYYAFKGIPYAKPPVGLLRFKDPVPIQPWSDLRDAIEFGPMCIQFDNVTRTVQGSDDCLYLNIYSKSIKSTELLPVMIFIHGGGFTFGSGDDMFYGPDYLLKKDIVFVTFNYRLGVFGFLDFGHEVSPGNQGLKDQVALLQWIQKNIKSFGGDPNNVTIFGESAGGSSVHYLALSNLSKGLFHKAISQSGVACNPWACTGNIQNAYILCKNLGNNSKDPEELVQFLRSLDCKQIIEAQENLRSDEDRLYCKISFSPGIDDKSQLPFMPVHPTKIMEEGVNIPFMLGCNVHEGVINLRGLKESTVDKFEINFEKYLNPVHFDLLKRINITPNDLKSFYFGTKKISLKSTEHFVNYCTDLHFLEGIHRVLSIQAKINSSSTYFYCFTYDKEISIMKIFLNSTLSGTVHFDECQFLFSMKIYDTLNINRPKPGSITYRIIEQMVEMWVNFAKYGQPTPINSDLIPISWLPITSEKTFCALNINQELKMENIISIGECLYKKKYKKNKL